MTDLQMTPRQVAEEWNDRLPLADQRVLDAVLYELPAGARVGQPYRVSVGRMSQRLGKSRRTLTTHLGRLREAGALFCENGGWGLAFADWSEHDE